MEISKKLCVSNNVLLIRNRKIGQKFFSFENFEISKNLTPFPRIGKNLKNSWKIPVDFSWYKNWPKVFLVREFRRFQEFYVIFKNFEDSKNFMSFSRISKVPRIWRHFQELAKIWKIPEKFLSTSPDTKIGQKFFSFENFEGSKNFMSFSRISKIPRIWRHFQELVKLEKFFDRSPVDLQVSWYKVEQFFENFEGCKNFQELFELFEILEKISRLTSCRLMFSWYKVEKLAKDFFRKFRRF